MNELEVVFEDDVMLVANKPAGWRVSAGGESRGGVRQLVGELALRGHPGLTPAHKVDDEVSGLVVLAKTKAALDKLSGEFQSKQARRIYRGLAVVAREGEELGVPPLPWLRERGGGLPAEFAVNYALGPDHHVPGRVHVYRKKGGRPALTHVRVMEDFGRWVWFEAEPETSRQQQVQAHLAAVGAPVLGDHVHGLADVELRLSDLKRGYKGRDEERPLVSDLALQATALRLRHPVSGETVAWELELSKTLAIALRNLRKFGRR